MVAIEITIAGQRYPLRVEASDEKLLRRAETEINERLKQLQKTPGARNAQDHMAMLLLSTWMEHLKAEHANHVALQQIDSKLNQASKVVNALVEHPSVD